MPKIAPYGSWPSSIQARDVAREGVRLGAVLADPVNPHLVYWSERRPQEVGRTTIVELYASELDTCEKGGDGAAKPRERLPAPWNVRNRVHEYGGGAYTAYDGVLYFSHFNDGRLYRQARDAAPQPLTAAATCAYADLTVDAHRARLLCVRELYRNDAEPRAAIVAVPLDAEDAVEPAVLTEGADFYSNPRVSPDGMQLCWISWSHPRMPWDGTELWLCSLSESGTPSRPVRVAGGTEESIFQPEWSPDGVLHFVSDRTGWWNLYRLEPEGPRHLAPMEAEVGRPQWQFAMSTYAIPRPDLLVAAYSHHGLWSLARVALPSGACEQLESPFTYFDCLASGCGRVVGLAAAPDQPPLIFALDHAAQTLEVLHRPAASIRRSNGALSEGIPISFPTSEGDRAFGFFYPPASSEMRGPDDQRPPLIIKSHGGPTAAADNAFDLAIQFWTSRGFAVVDVNYRGSTGFGRQYRQRLNGQWGVFDVDDGLAAADYLARENLIDRRRVVIRGGSAGGYTTLATLVFRQFAVAAGASYYGVGDLEALARDTHKFESRYLDGLIGPYPEAAELYRARSPVHFADQLAAPAIFFQGLEDKVVPPNQAATMVAALRAKGLPVAYLTFEGEGHGFRSAESIIRSLEAELTFYARVLGFEAAGELPALEIENL